MTRTTETGSASPFDAAYWEGVARDRAADCGRLQLALERWAAAFPHEAALREMTRAAIADDERAAVPASVAPGEPIGTCDFCDRQFPASNLTLLERRLVCRECNPDVPSRLADQPPEGQQ